jgi:MFS family permease
VFFFIFFAFNVGAALATNTTQFIVCRFFAGVGGSAPITVSSGTAVDLFDASKRGMALTMVSMGPLLGPIIGT